jgi:hypothetical protein
MSKPTPEMLRVLRAAVAKHTADVANEKARWGAESAASLQARGPCFTQYGVGAHPATVRALLARGLVDVYRVREGTYDTRPLWGRERRTHYYAEVTLVVTEAGRAAALDT